MRSAGAKNWLEVIGVAADGRHYGLETEVRPGVYVPFLAMPASNAGVVIRTKGDPTLLAPTIRSLLRDQDPALPVAGITTMESRVRDSLFIRRLYSGMTAGFALIAVAMSMTGLYGVIAYVVGRRTREFGIRIALGAQRGDVLRNVLGQGARLAMVGIVLGAIGGMLSGVAASKLMLGVSVFDPLVLTSTLALLCAIVAVACYIPARRATRVNPVEALRAE
jgi:putative ABC transport system permease protein